VKNGSKVVLDASALLALMRAEGGADRVAATIDHAVIGAVNLAEVTSKLVREEIASASCANGSTPSSWM
jgi:PIN domain nuclease of toxin-antitoxin system